MLINVGITYQGNCYHCFVHSVMLEALADGGVMMGLPRDVATELAAQGNTSSR